MKLGFLGSALVVALVGTPVMAKSHKAGAPRTEAACLKAKSKGYVWQKNEKGGTCVKAEGATPSTAEATHEGHDAKAPATTEHGAEEHKAE